MQDHNTQFSIQQATKQVDKLLSFVLFNSLDNEEWREIKDYDGIYFVSNKKRILSLTRNEAFIMSQTLHNGYLQLSLYKDGEEHKELVHRLIAIAFIDNPENKPIVHHIDGNKVNNELDNLMFVSAQEHYRLHQEMKNKKKRQILLNE